MAGNHPDGTPWLLNANRFLLRGIRVGVQISIDVGRGWIIGVFIDIFLGAAAAWRVSPTLTAGAGSVGGAATAGLVTASRISIWVTAHQSQCGAEDQNRLLHIHFL